MTILHFANRQNDVFLPALLALLVVAVAVALPVVLAPALRRSRRLRPVVALAAVVAAAGVAAAAWQAGIGFRTLQDERARVGQELSQRYDLRLTAAQVGELVDGGKPDLAAVDGVRPKGVPKRLAHLVAEQPDGDVYELRISGQVVQPTS